MGKVRYKELPESFNKIVAPSSASSSPSRASVGMEGSVGEYYYISLDKLRPYSKQARRSFDDTEIASLALTIKEHGVNQPLSVKKTEEGLFEIVSGERRFRAAKLAGLKKVPCIILDSNKDAEEIALIENIQRSDLHPLEISLALAELMKSAQRGDAKKLGERLGLSASQVSEYLSYQTIPQEIREKLLSQKVRGREVLRKFVKNGNYPTQELLKVLEPSTNDKTVIEREYRTKTLLKIYMDGGVVRVQKRAIYRLTPSDKAAIRKELLAVLDVLK